MSEDLQVMVWTATHETAKSADVVTKEQMMTALQAQRDVLALLEAITRIRCLTPEVERAALALYSSRYVADAAISRAMADLVHWPEAQSAMSHTLAKISPLVTALSRGEK